MTSKSRSDKAIEKMKDNPYFDKYASKIAQLQQTSPEELINRIERVEKEKERKKDELKAKERQFSQLLNPKSKTPAETERDIEYEDLNKIMKIDLVKDKSADEIGAIWLQYHTQKESTIAASIPANDFVELKRKSAEHPTFIFPLPRSQGYEFIMCQFERNSVHFTPLLYYQVHKENAPECLAIKHYTEFQESKGIVLMKGEYDKNIIDAKEAQCLANELQLYYSQNNAEKNDLLEKFTKKPDEFKHTDLIRQIETLALDKA